MWRRVFLLSVSSIALLACAPTGAFAAELAPLPAPPGSADASANTGPNDVVNVPDVSTTGTGTGFGAPDPQGMTVIPGTYGAGGVAAATGGVTETVAARGDLPFTGAGDLLGVFYGALVALALGSLLSLAGRRAERHSAHRVRVAPACANE